MHTVFITQLEQDIGTGHWNRTLEQDITKRQYYNNSLLYIVVRDVEWEWENGIMRMCPVHSR